MKNIFYPLALLFATTLFAEEVQPLRVSPQTIKLINSACSNSDIIIAVRALKIAGQTRSTSLLKTIHKSCQDPRPAVAEQAIKNLALFPFDAETKNLVTTLINNKRNLPALFLAMRRNYHSALFITAKKELTPNAIAYILSVKNGVSFLSTLLSDKSLIVSTLTQLKESFYKEESNKLYKLLKKNNAKVRTLAFLALARIAPGDTKLLNACDDQRASIRVIGAKAIKNITSPDAEKALLKMLKDKSLQVRIAAVKSAAAFPSKYITQALLLLLRSKSAMLRHHLITSLKEMKDDANVGAAVANMFDELPVENGSDCLLLLGLLDDYDNQALLEKALLIKDNPSVINALIAIANKNYRQLEQSVAAVIKHSDNAVLEQTMLTLKKLKPVNTHTAIIDKISNKKISSAVVAAGLGALDTLKEPSMLKVFQKYLTRSSFDVRRNAILGITSLPIEKNGIRLMIRQSTRAVVKIPQSPPAFELPENLALALAYLDKANHRELDSICLKIFNSKERGYKAKLLCVNLYKKRTGKELKLPKPNKKIYDQTFLKALR